MSDAPLPTEVYFEQDSEFGGPKNLTINGQRVAARAITIVHEMNEYSEVTVVIQGCRVTKGQEGDHERATAIG